MKLKSHYFSHILTSLIERHPWTFLFATMAFWLLVFISLLKTGFSAEISVLVQTGNSVHLHIQTQKLPEFDDLFWRYNESENIIKYIHASKTVKPHSSYKNRVDFNDETFSLTLKNMQKTDSGPYTARTSGETEKNIVTYRVSVIDAVEAPVLTVSSNWSSPDSCNFTCKGNDITVSLFYNSNGCSHEEVTSSYVTMKLNCIGDSIICNQSNPVSWKKVEIKEVNKNCTVNQGRYEEASAFSPWVIAIFCLITLGLLIALIGVGIYYFYTRKKGAQQIDQTLYAEVDENIKPQKKKSDSGEPDVTMETNQTSPNQDSVNQGASLTEKRKLNEPATIYCAIKKQPKAPKSDSDHTIYAMVSKPPAAYESVHTKPE